MSEETVPVVVNLEAALYDQATETQRKYLEAVKQYGSQRKAAEALGLHHSTVDKSLAALKRRVALKGHLETNEMTAGVPDPFFVKGISTQYGPDGSMMSRWVKTAVDNEHVQAMQKEFVDELCSYAWDSAPKAIELAASISREMRDLETHYPLGDHHFGMLAWRKETGDDWDTKLAKQNLEMAIAHLKLVAPPSYSAVFTNLGDLLHVDNRTNRTPQSGHILDVDSRYARIIRFAAYGMCSGVESLLSKHEIVKVINVPGNHDPDSASWVALVMEAYFRNNPRVIVETSPAKMLFHEFGANMIASTHGDTMKFEQIPGIMAALQPQLWGRANYRVCHTGHVHNRIKQETREYRGAHVEAHGVLPPSDSYGASLGYNSDRTMKAIVYHKEGGEQARYTYRIRPQSVVS